MGAAKLFSIIFLGFQLLYLMKYPAFRNNIRLSKLEFNGYVSN